MRIALISYQDFSGAGVLHAHAFANLLVDLGHEVEFYLNGDPKSQWRLAEPPRYRLREVHHDGEVLTQTLHEAAVAFDPDIVHAWTPRWQAARVALEIWSSTKAKLIIHYEDDEEYILRYLSDNATFSDDDLALYRYFSRQWPIPNMLEAWEARINWDLVEASLTDTLHWPWLHPLFSPVLEKSADAVTCISRPYQRLLRERFQHWDHHLLLPPVDLDRFASDHERERLRHELGVDGRTVFLYSGMVAEFHDFHCFLRALPRVVDDYPDLVVVQIGGDRSADKTEALLREYGLRDHLLQLGERGHSQMAALLSIADVFIGTVRNDVFNRHRLPSKLPEYMATGRPMIVQSEGFGEELEDGAEVFKVDSEDPEALAAAIRRAYGARETWPKMGERLRRKSQALFDPQTTARALVSFYEDVLAAEGTDKRARYAATAPEYVGIHVSADARGKIGPSGGKARILIATEATIGAQMTGTGIRYFELARHLADDFDVQLAHMAGEPEAMEGVATIPWSPEDPFELLRAADNADAILTHGFVLEKVPELRELTPPLIVDLYCPFIFENMFIHADRGESLEAREEIHGRDLEVLKTQVRAGDHFLVSNARQRDLMAGVMVAIGRLTPVTLEDEPGGIGAFVTELPMGVASEAPAPLADERVMRGVWDGVEEDDFVLLWGGGVWSWLDAETPIRAMAEIVEQNPKVKLVFLSTASSEDIIEMPNLAHCVALAKSLGLYGNAVIFNEEWRIPYAQRLAYFGEADLGVSGHPATLEADYAYRTRFLDYLAAGVPVFSSAGDGFSDDLAEKGMAATVPPGDVAAWRDAVLALAGDPERMQAMRDAVRVGRSAYDWTAAVTPLKTLLAEELERLWRRRDARARRETAIPPPQPAVSIPVPHKETPDRSEPVRHWVQANMTFVTLCRILARKIRARAARTWREKHPFRRR